MAAITQVNAPGGVTTTVISHAITNQSGAGGSIVAVQVPVQATGAIIYVDATLGGTSPLWDTFVYALDSGDLDTTNKGANIGTHTQLTATGAARIILNRGTTSSFGSYIGIETVLDGTTGDEDYTGTVRIEWIQD